MRPEITGRYNLQGKGADSGKLKKCDIGIPSLRNKVESKTKGEEKNRRDVERAIERRYGKGIHDTR